MDFLSNFLTLNTLAYALIGIPAFVGFGVFVRLSRKGRSSFDQRHEAMDQRIHQTSVEMDELNKTMRKEEQLHIIAAALREALLLHPSPQSFVEEHKDAVYLHLEKYFFHVEYKEKIQTLRSSQKTVYGQGYFEVFGPFPREKEPHLHSQEDNNTEKNTRGKIFYSLLELELYLTQKIRRTDFMKLPPALRPR